VATLGAGSAGSLRTIPLDPDRVFQIEAASQGAGSGAAMGAAAHISGVLDRMEYEARGLLNLVCFVSRCLNDSGCSQDERIRWREELDRANARLEALYRAGLPRDFLTNPGWREETVLYVPGGDL
jgi:hypothetical protein